MRAHVSFETAMRPLCLVDILVTFERQPASADEAARIRADQRRMRWTGEKSTLSTQASPPPSSNAVERLTAVARASRLAAGLQTEFLASAATHAAKSTK